MDAQICGACGHRRYPGDQFEESCPDCCEWTNARIRELEGRLRAANAVPLSQLSLPPGTFPGGHEGEWCAVRVDRLIELYAALRGGKEEER